LRFFACLDEFGHLVLGKDISILSVIGIVGLVGVVVNDSLILVPVLYFIAKDLDRLVKNLWSESPSQASSTQ
jgi:hypothetical protein